MNKTVRVLFSVLIGAGVVALFAAQVAEALPPPPSPVAKCHRFGAATPGDGNAFAQVAAKSGGVRNGDTNPTINGLDFKLAHVDVASQIVAPANGAYCYSIGAYTMGGYWLQMGYMVRAGENGGARWFIQILNPDGSTHTWKMSRFGEANPPPACSACSGGSTDGYPFGFNSVMNNRWTFYFDGISKATVNLGTANTALRAVPGNNGEPHGVYFIGEVTGQTDALDALPLMQPRVTLRTLTLWRNSSPGSPANNWLESKSATAQYFCGAGVLNCAVYGIVYPPPDALLPNRIRIASGAPLHPDGCYNPAQNHPGEAHMVAAGSAVYVTPAGGLLWDNALATDLCQ